MLVLDYGSLDHVFPVMLILAFGISTVREPEAMTHLVLWVMMIFLLQMVIFHSNPKSPECTYKFGDSHLLLFLVLVLWWIVAILRSIIIWWIIVVIIIIPHKFHGPKKDGRVSLTYQAFFLFGPCGPYPSRCDTSRIAQWMSEVPKLDESAILSEPASTHNPRIHHQPTFRH